MIAALWSLSETGRPLLTRIAVAMPIMSKPRQVEANFLDIFRCLADARMCTGARSCRLSSHLTQKDVALHGVA